MTALEKAARAIIDLDGRHGLAYTEAAAERLALRYARAVLMAVREEAWSLDRQISALVENEFGDGATPDIYAGAIQGFPLVIDAILKSGAK